MRKFFFTPVKRLAGMIISEMTCNVSSGMLSHTRLNSSTILGSSVDGSYHVVALFLLDTGHLFIAESVCDKTIKINELLSGVLQSEVSSSSPKSCSSPVDDKLLFYRADVDVWWISGVSSMLSCWPHIPCRSPVHISWCDVFVFEFCIKSAISTLMPQLLPSGTWLFKEEPWHSLNRIMWFIVMW